MTVRWIAARVFREIVRDRRTLAVFFMVPMVVMTLVYFAIAEEEIGRVAVVTRGPARLFEGELFDALEKDEDIELVSVALDDSETDATAIERAIRQAMLSGQADGVLYMNEGLLTDRFDGKEGTLHLYVEGSRPTRTAAVISGVAAVMDDLAAALPVVIDAECSNDCADSVNNQPMELEKHYLYGSDDYRVIDFFLPVLPPFFVFFLTFIISTVTFQRERARGTLERLLIAPVSFGQVVLGYIGGFLLFAGAEAAIILGYFLVLFEFPISGAQLASMAVITLITLVIALLIGLLASFLAHNEFQAVQAVPLVVLPQLFLSDIIWDINTFPLFFRAIAYVLPLTHANIAMRDVVLKGLPFWQSWPQLLVLGAFFTVVFVILLLIGRRPARAF